ncbi:lycopene cyclase domain-containing protein [Subsaxibacter sp. CAU 1640]|uniref:lycopene cyclase domain-containing protein n=1 Tax=Subsaxibacter sp. CAU 1640 TaxID=2933271 RepID=UPI00200551D1|nr:lycopene cyclase domain-containing protein [Subsaxibacter sp. CAU 1640]MCK7589850.1 lycopene cyclase domain-containing protein [Subsaxibacter sp. CAU 1640]
MTYLYLLLDIGSLSLPLIFSFHPKLKFYNYWKALFPAIVIMMAVFIPWDIIFTDNGFWGFNEAYFSGINIVNLPLEEWLFFICIPFACVFTHYSLIYFFPNTQLSTKKTRLITNILIILMLVLTFIFHDRWYPMVNFSYAILLLLIVKHYNVEVLQKYYLTFLIILIPFFIVNGILTGSLIENEVVWYNNDETMGVRIFTIPVEDSVYAFTMILTVLALTKYFKSKFSTAN